MSVRYYTRTGKHSGVSFPLWMLLFIAPFVLMFYLIVGAIAVLMVAVMLVAKLTLVCVNAYKARN